MKKWLLLLCLLLPLTAFAAPLELGEDLTYFYCYPEGSEESDAFYIYRAAWPQVTGDGAAEEAINVTYSYELSETSDFNGPISAEMAMEPGSTLVTYQVTCNNDDYFCVLLTYRHTEGDYSWDTVKAHTFARTGAKAGTVTSLPVLLGALSETETDEWLRERQREKCDRCVREMLWEKITAEADRGEGGYIEHLDREWFDTCFYPEEDFYMLEDGETLVFFLQPGDMTDEALGVKEFIISIEEIQDEL